MAGETDRSRELFEVAIGVRNDVDLLAEEHSDGMLLGKLSAGVQPHRARQRHVGDRRV